MRFKAQDNLMDFDGYKSYISRIKSHIKFSSFPAPDSRLSRTPRFAGQVPVEGVANLRGGKPQFSAPSSQIPVLLCMACKVSSSSRSI